MNDIQGENNIIAVLKQMIQIDDIPLLLIGNSASGKTRLLYAIIQEYYMGKTQQEINDNILFLNTLKEQGIHYYRDEVKTFCQGYSSIAKRKKMVIFDDIDFIGEQGQQIFRNYIENYSKNIYFISSCTNTHKIIESLQSRFTMLKLPIVDKYKMSYIFDKIQQEEKLHIDEDAKNFIIQVSNNSIQVLMNYMEKFKLLNNTISLDIANQLCTNISYHIFEQYTLYLKNNELIFAIDCINDLCDKGYSVMDILDAYFNFVKNTNLLNENEKYKFIEIICKYIHNFHNIHEDEIELSFLTNNLISSIYSI
jgi:DNA polymerase III delta prime subunit